MLVVALGVAPALTYMTASVTYSLDMPEDSDKAYRVGCRFHNRLKTTAQAGDAVPLAIPSTLLTNV